uniref:Peptidase S8/S53 domain-containing protein n=1 Tax=Fusarium oxysporum (strain Fo5176) TaxID=660025 RepID=A0A0C4DI89_FUSOF
MSPERLSACEMVAEVAKQVYALVMECGIRQRQRVAGEVGTRLGQIAQESFAGYELEDAAEEAAAKLLHTLLEFPTPAGSQTIPRQSYMHIMTLARPDNRSRLKNSISMSFIADDALPSKAKKQCDAFLAKLSQDEPKKKTGLDQLTTGSALPEPDDYPQHVSRNLFKALHQHAFCHHAEMPQQKSWLDKSKKSRHAQFEVVISSENMSYWQHLWLGIPIDHGAARQLLSELEKAQWARSTHRDIFARAVANCLDPRTFTTSNPKAMTTKSSTNDNPVTDTDGGGIRRKVYTEIVEPLSKLVNIAFKTDAKYVSYLARCREVENHNKLHSQVASFHTGKTVVPEEWLDNLKHISMHIVSLREKKPEHDFKPVKIAVLDTGCDADLPFCKIPRRKKSIKAWKDFTCEESEDTPGPDSMEDEYGHGSLMTRLIMEAAPLAHVYVVRVAKDADELEYSSDQISKAIRWAGLEAEVDIISMSFGFPHDDDAISTAIEEVERSREIIFLASAGNNAAYQREAFPARHRSVISHYCSRHIRGQPTNPPQRRDRQTLWPSYMSSWIIDSDSRGCWYSSVNNRLRRSSFDSSSHTNRAKPGKVFEENRWHEKIVGKDGTGSDRA